MCYWWRCQAWQDLEAGGCCSCAFFQPCLCEPAPAQIAACRAPSASAVAGLQRCLACSVPPQATGSAFNPKAHIQGSDTRVTAGNRLQALASAFAWHAGSISSVSRGQHAGVDSSRAHSQLVGLQDLEHTSCCRAHAWGTWTAFWEQHCPCGPLAGASLQSLSAFDPAQQPAHPLAHRPQQAQTFAQLPAPVQCLLPPQLPLPEEAPAAAQPGSALLPSGWWQKRRVWQLAAHATGQAPRIQAWQAGTGGV